MRKLCQSQNRASPEMAQEKPPCFGLSEQACCTASACAAAMKKATRHLIGSWWQILKGKLRSVRA